MRRASPEAGVLSNPAPLVAAALVEVVTIQSAQARVSEGKVWRSGRRWWMMSSTRGAHSPPRPLLQWEAMTWGRHPPRIQKAEGEPARSSSKPPVRGVWLEEEGCAWDAFEGGDL